ncbi:MAG: single-stranded DNA-binding protein [Desulfurellales bacterium]|nr:MAG: single-stranded DNA-binding protein [Desulfurellales bacterium]
MGENRKNTGGGGKLHWNELTLAGNLTADPTFRTANSGTLCAHFTIAWNEYRGESRKAHFFQCVAFGKIAERLQKYAAKGANVQVGGELIQEQWTDAATNTLRSVVKIRVARLMFVGEFRRRDDEEGPAGEGCGDPCPDSAFIHDGDAPF